MVQKAMLGLGLVAIGIAIVSCGHKKEAIHPGQTVATKTGINSPLVLRMNSTLHQIENLVSQHRYKEAEIIVDQNMSDKHLGPLMQKWKADIRTLDNKKDESIATHS